MRLFIARGAPNSRLALRNLRRILEERGVPDSVLEVVDVLENPDAALEHRVLVTPTLLRLRPEPQTRVIGSLADTALVADALQLVEPA